MLVLATLWPEYWDQLTARPPGDADPHAQARELLSGHDIQVPAALTPGQLRELEEAGDPRLAQAADGTRDRQVVQYLAGAPALLDRYHHAPPAAQALIHAAMDAARLGMSPRTVPGFPGGGGARVSDRHRLGPAARRLAGAGAGLHRQALQGGPRAAGTHPAPPRLRCPAQPRRRAGPGSWPTTWTSKADAPAARRSRRHPSGRLRPAARARPGLTALARAAEDCGLLRDAARMYKQASADGHPDAGASLVQLLHILHPGDPRPADWAAAHTSPDKAVGPVGVALLLGALRRAGATGRVTTLASRAAAHTSLDNLVGVTILLGALREAGASGQVSTLLDRDPAAHASLDYPYFVTSLLDALREAGAQRRPQS